VPFQRRFTPPVEPRLVGDDFDKNPIAHSGVTNVRLNRSDFHLVSAEERGEFIGVNPSRRGRFRRMRNAARGFLEETDLSLSPM
jgi:hypothetical protein